MRKWNDYMVGGSSFQDTEIVHYKTRPLCIDVPLLKT